MMGGEVQRGRGGDSRKNVHLISTSEQTSSASNAHNCFYGRSKPGENALLAAVEGVGGGRGQREGGKQLGTSRPTMPITQTNYSRACTHANTPVQS